MKSFLSYYIQITKHVQSILVIGSIGIFLLAFPMAFAFHLDFLPKNISSILYLVSYSSVTFVMAIRPLADIFPTPYIRMLVPLRKGFGILSASIIVSFILSKIIISGLSYFTILFSASSWKFSDYSIFAHLGDITAIILLATSNIFSKKLLGKNWKHIQKLAYVYFYAGGVYEVLAFHNTFAGYAMLGVSFLLSLAFIIKKSKKNY